MSEQLYYTFSNIGSGSSSGERIRAWSSGVGSVNSAPVQALRPYLLYRLPPGGTPHTTPDDAPISLTYAKTDHHTLLIQRVYAGKDGVGRPGNLFSHAILNPEKIAQSNQPVPLSAQDAIRLWRSPLWLTAEDQILNKDQTPNRSTTIDGISPHEITRHIRSDWPFLQNPEEQMKLFDWLPTVFSAFLMLKKLNKKQIYLAAPADIVAALIWCITRYLPRSLTIMQELTFSTYEHDITKSPVTIVGTCWLPPANHQGGPFIPTYDLSPTCYTDQSTILAINYYNSRKTPFNVEKHVQDFAAFATRSLRTNDTKDLDSLIVWAERNTIPDLDTFLIRIGILSEAPTEEKLKNILATPSLWSCLQFQNVQEQLIELLKKSPQTYWRRWWSTNGRRELQYIYRTAQRNPGSENTLALSSFASCILDELITELENIAPVPLRDDQKESLKFWDQTFKDASSLESAPDLWGTTLPERLAVLAYNVAYQFWWEQSGKQIVHHLVSSSSTGSQLTYEQRQRLQTNLQLWWDQSAERLKGAWINLYSVESEFWVNQLSVLSPPHNGDSNWLVLLNELDRIRPQEKVPVSMCHWDTYMILMASWLKIGQTPLDAWFIIPWQTMPNLLAIPDSEFPDAWKYTALTIKILHFQQTANISQELHSMACCVPFIHQVLVQLIQDDQRRQHAVTFCTFLLQPQQQPQHNYSQREQLLSTILPEIFPYEQEKQRIADAARLTPEQLSSYAEAIIYKNLTTGQKIPDWLLSVLRGYFTYFKIKAINPDSQPDQEKRKITTEILNILAQYNRPLPGDLLPYISFWHAISSFFQKQQSHFDAYTLKEISNHICHIYQIQPFKTIYAELQQELLSFLTSHIKTEEDLVRVIDHLQDALMLEQSAYPYKIMDMHKEITRLVGESIPKQGVNIAKTIICIKGLLNDAISLRNLNIGPIDQFVNECLNNLLSPLNDKQIRDIQSTQNQWNTDISKEWERYLNVYKAQRQSAKSSGFTPLWPRSSFTPTTNKTTPASSAYPPTTSNIPPQTKTYPQSGSKNATYYPQVLQGLPNQTSYPNQQLPYTIPQDQMVIPANSQTQPIIQDQILNKFENNPSFRERALQKLHQALDTRQADKVAAAYDEQLDPWITNPEIQQLARIAKQIVKTHSDGNATGDYTLFIEIYDYNAECRYFSLPKDIQATAQKLLEEKRKKQQQR